jgi:hypothetical protein
LNMVRLRGDIRLVPSASCFGFWHVAALACRELCNKGGEIQPLSNVYLP